MSLNSNLNILICESNISLRSKTKNAFSHIGFKNINYANDFKLTLETIATSLKKQRVELLVINGEENINDLSLLKNFVDKIPKKVAPKIITVISNSSQDLIVKLIGINLNHIIIKPFNQNQLIEKIADIFNQ